MARPVYLTPERAAELIAAGTVPGHLLCPHCRHVLYVGEKPPASGSRRRHKVASKKGVSRAKPPK